jgi:excisionase family DNA binding protein
VGLQTPQTAQTLKTNKAMTEELKQVADQVTANIINCTKEILTTDEAARYMGISKSYLYKLTMRQQIPHYKPMGKMCYFNRQELEQWLQSNRVSTDAEITDRAIKYCQKGGNR